MAAAQRRLALAALASPRWPAWAPCSLSVGPAAAEGSARMTPGCLDPCASFHSRSLPDLSAAEPTTTGAQQEQPSLIPFPREGPGVSYALNWALAAAGVTPAGTVSRNLKGAKLAGLAKGAPVKGASGSKVLVAGGKGEAALPPGQFKRLLKEVTLHLSGQPSLWVHDGAVGSSSSSDARVRVICESPAAAATLGPLLTPTPTRTLAAASFPITLYALPSYSNQVLAPGGFIAVDFAASLVVAAGPAVGDAAALQAVLAAAAAGPIQRRGGLPLPGRLVGGAGAHPFILLAPTAEGEGLLASASAWKTPGLIWGSQGVARLFPLSPSAPNLYKAPSALVLLTSDSTGGLAPSTQLTAQQSAFYFLAGYDGSSFHPALARSPTSLGSADPLSLAQTLAGLISTTNTPAYLVNVHEQPDLGKLVADVAAGKAPPSTPASDDAATQLKTKLVEFVKASFPNLPEGIEP